MSYPLIGPALVMFTFTSNSVPTPRLVVLVKFEPYASFQTCTIALVVLDPALTGWVGTLALVVLEGASVKDAMKSKNRILRVLWFFMCTPVFGCYLFSSAFCALLSSSIDDAS